MSCGCVPCGILCSLWAALEPAHSIHRPLVVAVNRHCRRQWPVVWVAPVSENTDHGVVWLPVPQNHCNTAPSAYMMVLSSHECISFVNTALRVCFLKDMAWHELHSRFQSSLLCPIIMNYILYEYFYSMHWVYPG